MKASTTFFSKSTYMGVQTNLGKKRPRFLTFRIYYADPFRIVDVMKQVVKQAVMWPAGHDEFEDPLLLLPKGEPVDNCRIIQQFEDLNRAILELCEDLIPPPKPSSTTSESEHAHFKLLASFNFHIHDRIFSRFHPSLTADVSEDYNKRYVERLESGK